MTLFLRFLASAIKVAGSFYTRPNLREKPGLHLLNLMLFTICDMLRFGRMQTAISQAPIFLTRTHTEPAVELMEPHAEHGLKIIVVQTRYPNIFRQLLNCVFI